MLSIRVRYRKFDYRYMELVHEGKPVPQLPIVDLCSDRVALPVRGVNASAKATESPIPAWQRWNDYGIACLIEGEPLHQKKGELKTAEAAFLLDQSREPPGLSQHREALQVAFDQGGFGLGGVRLFSGSPAHLQLDQHQLFQRGQVVGVIGRRQAVFDRLGPAGTPGGLEAAARAQHAERQLRRSHRRFRENPRPEVSGSRARLRLQQGLHRPQ